MCELCLVTSRESAQSWFGEMLLLTHTLEYLKSATYTFKCTVLSWTLISGWHEHVGTKNRVRGVFMDIGKEAFLSAYAGDVLSEGFSKDDFLYFGTFP